MRLHRLESNLQVNAGGGVIDFRNVVEALMNSNPGEVLVIDADNSPMAVAGELFTAEARRRGLAGILIEGACRDTPTIAKVSALYLLSDCSF
jgi:regulator of RNase E activity RraA